MDDRFTWKGEIVFRGSAKEFDRLAEILEQQPVEVGIAEWEKLDRPHLAGCNRIAVENIMDRARLTKIVADQPRIKVRFIKDIQGGIRSPHIHYEGEIVLLNRERFKMLVGDIASTMATARVDQYQDYINVMGPIGALADDPVPI